MEFHWLKTSAVPINAARGGVIDEAALVRALKEGRLARAVLDVQCKELPEADDPLCQNEKILLTPHMASNIEECMARMVLHAAWQIHKALSTGTPDWLANHPENLRAIAGSL